MIAGVALLTAAVGPCESQETIQKQGGVNPEAERLTVAPPPQQSDADKQQAHQAAPSEDQMAGAAPSLAQPPDKQTCSECDPAAEKRKEDRELSDLKAQWSMAWSTGDMVTISIVNLMVAAAGLAGIGWTIWETRRNAKAAILAADAAVFQNRAWCKIDDITLSDDELHGFDEDGFEFFVDVTISNTGNSPANHVFFTGRPFVDAGDDQFLISVINGIRTTSIEHHKTMSYATIFPHDRIKIKSHRVLITEEAIIERIAQAQSRNAPLVIYLIADVSYALSMDNESRQTGLPFVVSGVSLTNRTAQNVRVQRVIGLLGWAT